MFSSNKNKPRNSQYRRKFFNEKRQPESKANLPLRYSQNFIKSPELVQKVLKKSGLSSDYTIVEIGAGKGRITDELLKNFVHVIALEIDPTLHSYLQKKYEKTKNISLVKESFDQYKYYGFGKYAIVSNIPFTRTADVMKKITDGERLADEIVLFIQREAAYKFLGKPFGPETLASLILKTQWDGQIIHRCKYEDFSPQPKVSVVVMQLTKKKQVLPDQFKDFVAFIFSGWWKSIGHALKEFMPFDEGKRLAKTFKFALDDKISAVEFDAWVGIYQYILKTRRHDLAVCDGALSRLERKQSQLQKRHRTNVRTR